MFLKGDTPDSMKERFRCGHVLHVAIKATVCRINVGGNILGGFTYQQRNATVIKP